MGKFEIALREQNFLGQKNHLSKILILIKDVKMKLRIITKNLRPIQRNSFSRNRLNG